jgi:hypothetical protein
MFICTYVAVGTEEAIKIGFQVNWRGEPPDATRSFIVRLDYSDLGRRKHSVDIHLVIARSPNYVFGGGKQIMPTLFMTARKPNVKEVGMYAQFKEGFRKLRAWWQYNTVDRWEV